MINLNSSIKPTIPSLPAYSRTLFWWFPPLPHTRVSPHQCLNALRSLLWLHSFSRSCSISLPVLAAISSSRPTPFRFQWKQLLTLYLFTETTHQGQHAFHTEWHHFLLNLSPHLTGHYFHLVADTSSVFRLQNSTACQELVFRLLIAIYGQGNGNPVQYSCLKNPMDRGAWWSIVQRVLKSWTWLSYQACVQASLSNFDFLSDSILYFGFQTSPKYR